MFSWLFDVIGICLGNTLWLAGMIALGTGIFCLKVRMESIQKAVKLMSAMTGGKPKGFVKQLNSLIDPIDRRKDIGRRALLAAAALIAIGCTLVGSCAG
jgi:hypothetical protein